jgi:hypothetical protein
VNEERWHRRCRRAGGPARPGSGRGRAGSVRRSRGAGRPPRAADPVPGQEALVHELVTAAGEDGDEARRPARRLAALLPAEVRLVLLNALAEAGRTDGDGPAGHGTGRAVAHGSGGEAVRDAPELALPPAPHGPGGDGPGSRQGACGEPPGGVIRLRFADAPTLARAHAAFTAFTAVAAFTAGSGPGLGGMWSDPATLSLRIAGDAGVATLRAVLAVLDSAALPAESLTVHTHELDDVFAAFTGLL